MSTTATRGVLVAGATGVVGRPLLVALRDRGWRVRALVRDARGAQAAAARGAEPVHGDLLDAASVERAARGVEAVIHTATAIPRDRDAAGAWQANDEIRTRGTRHLIAAARQAGARHLVAQSVVMLYGDHGDDWIDEETALDPDPPAHLRSAAELEQLALAAKDLAPVVVRGGMLFGAGTELTEELFRRASRGELTLDGDGSHYLSCIHPADLAQVFCLALEAAPATVLNAVDDEPVRQRDLFAALVEHAAGPRPPRPGAGRRPASRRVANARLRATGFRPRYPTYREALRELAHMPT